jgi:uncharacterized protein (TIGR03067 family)
MKGIISTALVLGTLLTPGRLQVFAGSNEEIVKAQLAKIQGEWTFESQEEEGKALPRRVLKGRRIFIGGDRAIVRDYGELIQAASLKFDPKTPGALDMTILAGPYQHITMLGIYELKGDTFKVCFDRAGRERPTSFTTTVDSGLFSAVYRREKPQVQPDIAGMYQCDGLEADGNRYTAQVEIRRLGDAYAVSWARGTVPIHIGVGVRKGDVLAVSFASKGGGGIAVYQISKDRKLQGEWTDLGGIGVLRTETLTPK